MHNSEYQLIKSMPKVITLFLRKSLKVYRNLEGDRQTKSFKKNTFE